MWLFVFLAIVAAVGAFLWWVVGQPKTEPQAPLLPGVFGPNEDVLEEAGVLFEQEEPLGDLHVTWTGTDEGDITVGDDYEGAPQPQEPDGNDDD